MVARTNLVMLNPDGSLGPDLGYPNAQWLAQSPDGGIAVGYYVSLSVEIRKLNADGVEPTPGSKFHIRTIQRLLSEEIELKKAA